MGHTRGLVNKRYIFAECLKMLVKRQRRRLEQGLHVSTANFAYFAAINTEDPAKLSCLDGLRENW